MKTELRSVPHYLDHRLPFPTGSGKLPEATPQARDVSPDYRSPTPFPKSTTNVHRFIVSLSPDYRSPTPFPNGFKAKNDEDFK